MWLLLSRKVRRLLLIAIALPVARVLVHRLAVSAEHHDARSARLLRRADSAVTAVSRSAKRPAKH